jgi:predicted TIM-barrel fold metal-dependent hydrolase
MGTTVDPKTSEGLLLMQVNDLILVSADDHVIEPANMFDEHVPASYRDRAPRVVLDSGVERWVFDGEPAGAMGLNAVISWPKEEWGLDPVGFAEMRPGAYDIHERVRDMNRNGILASMCFPTFAGFSAGTFHAARDKDLSLMMLQAYNDWHIQEWCGTYPGRFIPLAIPPIWDTALVATEIRRVASQGCRAMSMPELPHMQGLPSYNDLDYWAPVFGAASEERVVMCMHIGQGFDAINGAPNGPIDNLIILAGQVSMIAAQDMLWGGALRTYPDLKVAWSEAGIGWVPFYLDRCDRHYKNQRWLGHDFGGKLPSDVFREHSLSCYVTDPTALKVRKDIGIDTIAWECDYPHSDAIWPDAPEQVLAELNAAQASDEDIHKITWQNSCRHFGFDPFEHTDRVQATVGNLRSQSPDVDTEIRSRTEWRALYEAKKVPNGVVKI